MSAYDTAFFIALGAYTLGQLVFAAALYWRLT